MNNDDVIPKWLKDQIAFEEMVDILGKYSGKDLAAGKASDAAVVACLMDASLKAPMPHDVAQIYLYLGRKTLLARGMALPPDQPVLELNKDQERTLDEIRRGIYKVMQKNKSPLEKALTEVFGKPGKTGKKAAPV